jgi:hypothetical protein
MSNDEKELIKQLEKCGAITTKKIEKKDIGYLYEVDKISLTQNKN